MQKNFQHRKVRDAEAGRGDTSGIDLCESAVSLHENQPEMDTGSVGRAGIRIVHGIIFISRYFLRKTFFETQKPKIRAKPQISQMTETKGRYPPQECIRNKNVVGRDSSSLLL